MARGRCRLESQDDRFASRKRRGFAPTALLLIAFLAAPAAAAPLGVTPTQIDLNPHQRSDLIAVTNEGDDEVRLQVEAFDWDQRPNGETVLAPTQDIVAFPPLLAVGAHETKRIRVGAEAPPAAAEKSYRLIIQELPPAPKEGVTGVQMLTNFSLPIFLGPGVVSPEAKIEPGPISGGAMTFAVHDQGTQHFMLRGVVVTGTDQSGAKTFEAKASGWYVLAGGTREYRLALSQADCRASKELRLEAQLQDGAVEARVPLAADSCGSGAKTQFIVSGEAAR